MTVSAATARRILCVAGARPNFMKVAPVLRALAESGWAEGLLVHTGQHYDEAMSGRILDELGVQAPIANLAVGSGSHAVQTAEVMRRFEPVLAETAPDAVLVVGDVNSSLACALVAAKLGVPVVHVEAGLRSFDRTMPEEINRVLTDQISDVLFATEESAVRNLAREGIDPARVHLVGNVMIDTLLRTAETADPPARVLEAIGLDPGAAASGYGILTLHRPSNVDDPAVLARIVEGVRHAAARLPIVFPLHPRLRAAVARGAAGLAGVPGLHLREPLGYRDMVGLLRGARIVLTDSGGLQEETTALGIPCLTLRENTERPITVEQGTNRLVGGDPARIAAAVDEVLDAPAAGRRPALWDGRAAVRIAEGLRRHFPQGASPGR